MVAVIHASSSLRRALNYNEQKVKEKFATCFAAVNYPKDVEDLNFYQKLNRLQNLAALNVRTKVNSIHISLKALDTLMQPEYGQNYLPYQLKKKNKKKKRKRISNNL